MDPDLNQKLAELTMKLIDRNWPEADIVNDARHTLIDLTKYWEYQEVENPRPESIGQGHRIIIMMKAEIKDLKQEVEDLKHKTNSLHTGLVGDPQ